MLIKKCLDAGLINGGEECILNPRCPATGMRAALARARRCGCVDGLHRSAFNRSNLETRSGAAAASHATTRVGDRAGTTPPASRRAKIRAAALEPRG